MTPTEAVGYRSFVSPETGSRRDRRGHLKRGPISDQHRRGGDGSSPSMERSWRRRSSSSISPWTSRRLRGELPEGEARRAQDVEPRFFRTIRVRDGRSERFDYEEPFASLLGSHKGSMVEVRGFEPLSQGDRLGLLRAQPVVRSRLGPPTGGGILGQPGCDVPPRPPDGTSSVSPAHDARPRPQDLPGRTATYV